MSRGLWGQRHLVVTLARRQYAIRYRQSLGGYLWALLPPLAMLGAGTLVFHRVAGIQTGETPYVLFALAGLVPWTFFANCLILGAPSVTGALTMVTRFPFPRGTLPLSMIGIASFDFGLFVVVFSVIGAISGLQLHLGLLWLAPLIAIELVLVVGIVLLISALNVFARDFKLAVPLGVQLWLLITPVMYPLDRVPEDIRQLYSLNPMTGIVESFRSLVLGGATFDPSMMIPAAVGALVMFTIGAWYFASVQSRFADVV